MKFESEIEHSVKLARLRDLFARYRPIVDNWDAFEEVLLLPLPLTFYTNTQRVSPNALLSILAEEGIQAEALSWNDQAFKLVAGKTLGASWSFLAGLYHIQEEVSMLPVTLLDPRVGERILDLCAAPGSKTIQILLAMKNEGTVVANDRNLGRLRVVNRNLNRLGLISSAVTACDGTNYPKAAGSFDRILVDAPCSAQGISRKIPRAMKHWSDIGNSMKLGRIQKALLRKAFQLCEPGGRIVYSTCTYAPEENESVVNAILEELGPRGLELIPARISGFHCAEGLTEWQGQHFSSELRQTMRVWPHLNDSGGFLSRISKSRKKHDLFVFHSHRRKNPSFCLRKKRREIGVYPIL